MLVELFDHSRGLGRRGEGSFLINTAVEEDFAPITPLQNCSSEEFAAGAED